jgi:hypothetical protein
MALPPVELPTLRAFLGAIALGKTTSQTTNRSLYKLQNGLTVNDVAVKEVVNAAIDVLDEIANGAFDELAIWPDGVTAAAKIIVTDNNPDGAITAPQGSLCLNRDGTNAWINTNGATAWSRLAFKYEVNQGAGAYGSRPSATGLTNGARWVATDSPVAEWVRADGVWCPIVDGVVGAEVPSSGWSWVNQGGAAVSESLGVSYLSAPSDGSTNLRLRVRTAPTPPYTITACVALAPSVATAGIETAGLVFRESGSGKIALGRILRYPLYNGGDAYYHSQTELRSTKYTNATTISAEYSTGSLGTYQPRVWLRIADNSTNRVFSASSDGRNFATIHTVGRTDFLTADQVGFCVEGYAGAASATLLSWAVT